MAYGHMTKKQFDTMYEQVKELSKTGETSTGTDEVTSLHDWMYEGDLRDTTPEQVAREWDELNEEEE